MSRDQAIKRCFGLGRQFGMHFIKCYYHRKAIKHWVEEMLVWYADVAEIQLKPKGELLSDKFLKDWFFGAIIDQDYSTKLESYIRKIAKEYEFIWDRNSIDDLCKKYWAFAEKVLATENIDEGKMLQIIKKVMET
jgi:hypothetical protein